MCIKGLCLCSLVYKVIVCYAVLFSAYYINVCHCHVIMSTSCFFNYVNCFLILCAGTCLPNMLRKYAAWQLVGVKQKTWKNVWRQWERKGAKPDQGTPQLLRPRAQNYQHYNPALLQIFVLAPNTKKGEDWLYACVLCVSVCAWMLVSVRVRTEKNLQPLCSPQDCIPQRKSIIWQTNVINLLKVYSSVYVWTRGFLSLSFWHQCGWGFHLNYS